MNKKTLVSVAQIIGLLIISYISIGYINDINARMLTKELNLPEFKLNGIDYTPITPIALVNKTYDEKEINCLARNIYFEARNQSILGQKYVAWVTMNRVKNRKWPGTICKVVWQKRQFSWTHDGKSDKPRNKLAYDIATLIAKDILYEVATNGEDLTNGAVYYHADYVKPFWKAKMVEVATVESHIFYKLP